MCFRIAFLGFNSYLFKVYSRFVFVVHVAVAEDVIIVSMSSYV